MELDTLRASSEELSSKIATVKDVERTLEGKIEELTSELEVCCLLVCFAKLTFLLQTSLFTRKSLEEHVQQREQELENTLQTVHSLEASVSKYQEKNDTLMQTIAKLRNDSAVCTFSPLRNIVLISYYRSN